MRKSQYFSPVRFCSFVWGGPFENLSHRNPGITIYRTAELILSVLLFPVYFFAWVPPVTVTVISMIKITFSAILYTLFKPKISVDGLHFNIQKNHDVG